MDKEYVATLHLGAVSDTFDRTGKIRKIEDLRFKIED
jgi:tRNA U55 pseudouridine synthase TruB